MWGIARGKRENFYFFSRIYVDLLAINIGLDFCLIRPFLSILQNARTKGRRNEGKLNFRITAATHKKDLTKTGKHSLPYIIYVRSN